MTSQSEFMIGNWIVPQNRDIEICTIAKWVNGICYKCNSGIDGIYIRMNTKETIQNTKDFLIEKAKDNINKTIIERIKKDEK